MESKPFRALDRVEEALHLIKRHDALNYSRVRRHLDRIWVAVIPSAGAHYNLSLNACVLDERYVLEEGTTIAKIASAIVHEATHARLDGWGVAYLEEKRTRIEAICRRRELNFLAKVPGSGPLQEEFARSLDWLAANHDYYADGSLRERMYDNAIEDLRYLNMPDWVVRFVMWLIHRQRLRRARRMENAGTAPPSRDFH
jgi:hypothetical protein